MSGGVDYFTHCDSSGTHDLWFGEADASRGGLPDRPALAPRGRLRRAHGAGRRAPFFLSLHYTAPHWPWETREDAARRRPTVKDNLFHLHGGNIHTYRRMIRQMDEGIGWIMAALEQHGIARRHAGRLHQRQRRRALLRQLAAGRRQDGPDRRRHPRAVDRALAGAASPAGGDERAALHDDGLVGDDARRGGGAGADPALPARRRVAAAGAARRRRAPSRGRCTGA